MRRLGPINWGAGLTALALFLLPCAASAQTVIPQTGWTLVSVDSEASGYNGARAFDGSPSTMWHTQFVGSNPATPHEIVINLGASHSVSGFRYLPRQDGATQGNIKGYEFYVSTDGVTWGSPVASGEFLNSSSEQQIIFGAAKTGQYIRLRALTEVLGRPWTSVAELNALTGGGPVSGPPGPPGPPGPAGPPGPPGPAGTNGVDAPLAYGVGRVNVQRGAGAATTWAYYSTRLGSPLGADLNTTTGGDVAGGAFRFTCNNTTHVTCRISIAAATMANSAGQTVYVYPRLLIYRQDWINAQEQRYCEYGDGAAEVSGNAVYVPVPTQVTTSTPTYTPMQIHIGGTADCFGALNPTAGLVNEIILGQGYYDVFATFVFKKP